MTTERRKEIEAILAHSDPMLVVAPLVQVAHPIVTELLAEIDRLGGLYNDSLQREQSYHHEWQDALRAVERRGVAMQKAADTMDKMGYSEVADLLRQALGDDK